MGGEKSPYDSSLGLPGVRTFLGHREINTFEGNRKTGEVTALEFSESIGKKNSRRCWELDIPRTDGAIP